MKSTTKNYKVSELLGLMESEKLIIPNYQRNFVTSKANQENIARLINANSFCGMLTFRKVGSILEILDGQQRVTVCKSELVTNLDYSFPCLIYSDIEEAEAIAIFEDINGKFRTTLKNSEMAKNHLEMPLNWTLADSFANLSINCKRYDNASLFQYSCQLFDMVELGEFKDFSSDIYEYSQTTIDTIKDSLYLLTRDIVKEKWNISQLPFFLYFSIEAVKAGYTMPEYQGFLQEFLNSQGNNSEVFKANCKSGTTKKGNVIARYTALKAEFESKDLHSYCYKVSETKKKSLLKKAEKTATQKEIDFLKSQLKELKELARLEAEVTKEVETIETMELDKEMQEV